MARTTELKPAWDCPAGFFIIWAVFAALYWGCCIAWSPYNAHVQVAAAWLAGHLYIDPTKLKEHVMIGTRAYAVAPPLGAFTCLPFVALFGPRVNEALVSAIVGGLDVALAWRMLRSWWLTAFFAFGTVVMYEASAGDSWGLSSLLACGPILAALTERRPWLAGFYASLACLARYDMVLVLPVLLWMFRRDFSAFIGGILPAALAYMLLNVARFNQLFDPTEWLWYQVDGWGAAAHPGVGPFSIHHLPLNLYTALFVGPFFQFHFPWLRPQMWGQSLLLTSPALLLAFRAPMALRETWYMWTGVILSMSACMLCWNNGWAQFGDRYWIQALPFFLVLMAMQPIDQLAKILIVASIIFCGWSMYCVDQLGLLGIGNVVRG